MVKKRLAMRMVTIFVALIVCGMFFPNPARGDENLSSDKGFNVVFEDLQLDEPSTVPVVITNDSAYELRLILLFNQAAGCNFEYDGPYIQTLSSGEPLTVNFTYTPANEDLCTAELQIMYTGSPSGTVVIELIGELEIMEEPPQHIIIGGINTGVENIKDEDGEYIGDRFRRCEEDADNPGRMVRCITWNAIQLKWNGLISSKEKRKIRRTAMKAAIRQMIDKMKKAKRSGRRDRRSSRFWRSDIHRHWHDR